MAFRVTLFFEWAEQGWDENWYSNADDRTPVISQAIIWASERRKLLSRAAFVTHLRISDVNTQRDAYFSTYNGNTGRGTWPGAGAVDDEVTNAAVNWRIFSSPALWRSYLLRGLAVDAVKHDQTEASVAVAFRTALTGFFKACKDAGFCLRKASYSAPQVVTAVTQTNNRLLAVTLDAIPAGLVAGDVIQIRSMPELANSSGLWRVYSVNNLIVNLYQKIRSNQGTYTVPPGRAAVRRVTYTYIPLASHDAVGVTTRKTGKPSYVPVGRRRVQRV